MTDGPVPLCGDSVGVRMLSVNRAHRKNAVARELWIALAQGLIDADQDVDLREETYA